jgi:hypothetical protein
MRKLYLHVGVHRTATTSIQRFLRENFGPLVTRGYLFPFGVARHNALVSKVRYGTMSAEELAQDLIRRMEAKGPAVQTVVLSDEDISMIADLSAFACLTRHFEVKVVVSLRRQDLWLESWYLQNVKWQWDASLAHVSFAEFLERRDEFFWIDYASRLARYEAVFGPGSVVAGVFEEADMPDGPIDAFLAMIGITDQTGFGPKLHHNSSLSPLASEFMRQMPLDEMPGPDRKLFEKAFLEMDTGLVTNGSKLLMPLDQRQAVMADYAAGNAAVAQARFGRDQLFRAPLPGAEAPLANTDLPQDGSVLMRDFMVPLVRAMGKQMAEARKAADIPGERRGQGPKKDRVNPRT